MFQRAWCISKNSFSLCPVRPSHDDRPCEDEEEGCEHIGDSHIEADHEDLVKNQDNDVVDIDEDIVVQNAEPLPEPRVPMRAHISSHNITHMPYRSWCKHCVAARRRNNPHLRSTDPSQRSNPLLVADYCFVRNNHDKELSTILEARLLRTATLTNTLVRYSLHTSYDRPLRTI